MQLAVNSSSTWMVEFCFLCVCLCVWYTCMVLSCRGHSRVWCLLSLSALLQAEFLPELEAQHFGLAWLAIELLGSASFCHLLLGLQASAVMPGFSPRVLGIQMEIFKFAVQAFSPPNHLPSLYFLLSMIDLVVFSVVNFHCLKKKEGRASQHMFVSAELSRHRLTTPVCGQLVREIYVS